MDGWTDGVPHEASFQICLKLLYKDFAFQDHLHGRTPGNPRLPHFQRFMKIKSKNYQRVWEIEALVWSTSPLCTLWAFTVGSGAERTRTDISADLEDRGVACTAGSKGGSRSLPWLDAWLFLAWTTFQSFLGFRLPCNSAHTNLILFIFISPHLEFPLLLVILSLPYRASPC